MKENINYGEARRQQILKGFTNIEECAEEMPIEKARHGVYADNAQNRRLQRVGQEYGHAAQEKPEAEQDNGGGVPEANVSLQNHARQASEEALVKVANDPSADAEMRKVATAELERRGVSVRAKNKNGDTSLRNGLADGDAKSVSAFESMGFRQMDDEDLAQYAGVEDAAHAFIKQIGGDEDGFDLVVTKTSEGYRVDKYPYADVDNFETTTVKDIADVEEAASKFGDPDAKNKLDDLHGSGESVLAKWDAYLGETGEGDDFSDALERLIDNKGEAKAIKELVAAIKASDEAQSAQSDLDDFEIASEIENMFNESGVVLSKKGLATLRKMKDDSDAAENTNDAEGLVQSFDKMAEGDEDFDSEGFKSFVKQKGDAKAIKELAAAMKANPADTGGAQSDATDDELADTIENMFNEAGVEVSKDGQKELDALRGGEKESDTKQAKKAVEGDAKSAEKDADSNAGSKIANEFTNKVLSGVKPEQYAKMFAKNPAEIASALAEQINSSDKRTASDAKFAAAQLAVFMDPKIRESGIGKEISNHPELKEFVEEYDEARELTNGVYEDYKYRQAVMQQLNEFKRTRNGFVSKLLEIYGGKKDK